MAGGIVGEFFDLKEDTEADLLAMQCGDFYEFFADDAETVAEELDLTVSQKSSHGSSYPMAGVPVDDLTPYLTALVERGYRVAVADQYETDDGHAREITRLVTPGTLLETSEADAQYLAALVTEGEGYGLAFADVTTGQFRVAEAAGVDEVLTQLYRFDPVEVLPGPDVRTDDRLLDQIREGTDAALTLHTAEAFAPGKARHRVREQFDGPGSAGTSSGGGGPSPGGPDAADHLGVGDLAVRAAGAVLSYVDETGVGVLASMTRLQKHGADDHVALDATTQRNLELVETMRGGREGSLLDTIDHTVTSAGNRLLAEWLTRPSCDIDVLTRRQESVGAFAEAAMARDQLREALSGAYDLERLAARATSGTADPRQLRSAGETLALFERLTEIVAEDQMLGDSPLLAILNRPDAEAAANLASHLQSAIVDDPPGTTTKGGIFRRGYDEALDEVIEEHEAVQSWLADLPEREKRRHGITHLSVDRNQTDGYYIQVGNSETDAVPEEYDQVKSLKNSTRYTIPELDEREREILRLEERRHDLEAHLFEDLRATVADSADILQAVGRAIAEVDALASLATHAVRNDWARPELHAGPELEVTAGRHPVVEQSVEFVPNDLSLDASRRFLIVTGPNMSGKSTYMRQAALITLLAQVGGFVPATDARVGIVDGIYTRVGALDELAQGRSTFMVEMQELSNILHSATEDSLVILDEVGRGTATYDGISIAWAATEYLHNSVGAKTLFATHYHELTSLADHLDRVANVHVAADESGGEVTFLRTVRDGPTDRSYGVHVADLAGVPDPVVDRSREVLDRLREEKAIEARGSSGGDPVQAVFDLSDGQFRTRSGGEDRGTTADGGRPADDGPSGDGSRPVDGDHSPEVATTENTAEADSSQATADGSRSIAGNAQEFDQQSREVIAAIADLDVEETAPVELMAQVRDWQRQLDAQGSED